MLHANDPDKTKLGGRRWNELPVDVLKESLGSGEDLFHLETLNLAFIFPVCVNKKITTTTMNRVY